MLYDVGLTHLHLSPTSNINDLMKYQHERPRSASTLSYHIARTM